MLRYSILDPTGNITAIVESPVEIASQPSVAGAIMRVAMYEALYRPDIPNGVAVNEAVEIAKKYETPETVRFINGILGSFIRDEVGGEQ